MTTLTYAIGDVHGCYDQLAALVDKCLNHAGSCSRKFVFIGDYVDRGPQSRQVISYLMDLAKQENIICLKGNHEDMMTGGYHADNWWSNGGRATLSSYASDDSDPVSWYNAKVRPDHYEWAKNLPTQHEDEHRIYVHAGLAPFLDLDKQDDYTRLWIRDPFLLSNHDFGKLVVHGHTPYNAKGTGIEIRPNRVNLDTSCVFGGQLTAAIFTDDQRDAIDFLQVDGPPRKMS